ncbi:TETRATRICOPEPTIDE REPEAT PROTEIN 1 [Salix koriyanagi]|uniref:TETRATRICOPEPTIDE REPEAT PROTEIN 1 n=1 Tax=Salix koriyanagi TaxID=2511006 RepID=A0A9Q0VCK2_9ROSI|nr:TETRATRICOPEPTIDE REPEAT PROTEIN 1 [Salix koriyanagi]
MVVIQPEEENKEAALQNLPKPRPTASTSKNHHQRHHHNKSSTNSERQRLRWQQHTQNDTQLIQGGVEQGNEAKLEGNRLFGNGQYEEALLQYELALQVAPQDVPSSVELRSICHFNRGVCFLKLGKYEDTIKECSKASELNPSYMKALVRRGEAHEKLEHFERLLLI